jgi:hypothetical protein
MEVGDRVSDEDGKTTRASPFELVGIRHAAWGDEDNEA